VSADAVALFEALFGGCESGFVELRPVKPGGGVLRREFFPVAELERAAERALELRERADVYFGVAPRSREAGTKDAVDRLPAVWAEFDRADAAGRLESFGLPPSALVASGTPGHLHAYWLLAHPSTPGPASS
jgi:hypothetical protein